MTWSWTIAVLAAFIIKGMCGFANTLVFSTIMSITQNNINITPIELIIGYPSNLILAWQNRKEIFLPDCTLLATLVMLGAIPGTWLLKHTDTQLLKVIFGIVVIIIATEMLLRQWHPTHKPTNKYLLIILGVLSGVLCGLFGVGALLAAYVSRTTVTTAAFKGTLSVVFLVENTFRLLLYAATGILNLSMLKTALWMLPAMFVGLWLGMWMAKRVKESSVKLFTLLMLMASGFSLVIVNW